ncbi:hypothetical protein ACXWO0_10485, partial [Streptococcus pyogenes]
WFDLTLALLLAVVLSPLWLTRLLAARWRSGRIFEREPLLGRERQIFERLAFAGPGAGRGLAVLFNILRGEMAFAGPRPLTVV